MKARRIRADIAGQCLFKLILIKKEEAMMQVNNGMAKNILALN
jgi:hypothetical protein